MLPKYTPRIQNGRYQKRSERKEFVKTSFVTFLGLLALMGVFATLSKKDTPLHCPKVDGCSIDTLVEGVGKVPSAYAVEILTPTPSPTSYIPDKQVDPKEISVFIDQAVQEFLPTHYSESMMIMHCLAHRENGHASNLDAHGDNGKAGGAFQFWESTWIRMRKAMIADGVAEELGSRYDVKEAARTTAYAISKGWGKEWGPIYRKARGEERATCQVPSWYVERFNN